MHIDVQNIRGGQNFGDEGRCRIGMYDNICDMKGRMTEKWMAWYRFCRTYTNQK
jgi:hypothetical protein